MYYVYMLRCEDNSIYTGITVDIYRRLNEHFSKGNKCAKYTQTHPAKNVECVWQTNNRMLASKLEFYIKTLSKKQKEELILQDNLSEYFENKIEIEKYIRLSKELIKV